MMKSYSLLILFFRKKLEFTCCPLSTISSEANSKEYNFLNSSKSRIILGKILNKEYIIQFGKMQNLKELKNLYQYLYKSIQMYSMYRQFLSFRLIL